MAQLLSSNSTDIAVSVFGNRLAIWCGLAFSATLVLTGCRRASDIQSLTRKDWETVRSNTIPLRVPVSYLQYRTLLNNLYDWTDTGKTISPRVVIEAIPDKMMADCGSPLIVDDAWGEQKKVFSLGTNLVALTFVAQEDGVQCNKLIACRLSWLVKGLRQEPGISARFSACVIERDILENLQQRQGLISSDVSGILRDQLVSDELRSTCVFLIDLLSDSRFEDRSVEEQQLYSDVHKFLQALSFFPRDYESAEKHCQEQAARLGTFNGLMWANEMHEIFTGWLYSEILLQKEKGALTGMEQASGIGDIGQTGLDGKQL